LNNCFSISEFPIDFWLKVWRRPVKRFMVIMTPVRTAYGSCESAWRFHHVDIKDPSFKRCFGSTGRNDRKHCWVTNRAGAHSATLLEVFIRPQCEGTLTLNGFENSARILLRPSDMTSMERCTVQIVSQGRDPGVPPKLFGLLLHHVESSEGVTSR